VFGEFSFAGEITEVDWSRSAVGIKPSSQINAHAAEGFTNVNHGSLLQ
jgi:hypothetical protein